MPVQVPETVFSRGGMVALVLGTRRRRQEVKSRAGPSFFFPAQARCDLAKVQLPAPGRA